MLYWRVHVNILLLLLLLLILVLTFAQRCINCDNNLVNFVVRYAIWYGRLASPLGCSVFQCCSKYDFEYEDVTEPSVY